MRELRSLRATCRTRCGATRSIGTLRGLEDRRIGLLGLADPQGLAVVTSALKGPPAGAAVADRHRAHSVLRDLLERLAAARPVVLCLDDVHWADPASLDALAALVSRPPAAAVLLALAGREGQLPVALSRALAGAMVEDRVARILLGPLDAAEASELIGEAPTTILSLSGGNPFYGRYCYGHSPRMPAPGWPRATSHRRSGTRRRR